MITGRQYAILNYYLVRALFLGTALSYIVQTAGNAATLSALIGIGLGVLFNLFIYYINNKKGNLSIVEYLSSGPLGFIGRILLLAIGIILFNDVLVSISTMAYAFYLVNTPVWMITLTLVLVVWYTVRKGIPAFARAMELLIPISILIFVLKTLGYGGLADLNNFKPYLDAATFNIFKGSMIFLGNTIAPSLLLLNFKNTDIKMKHQLSGYFIGISTVLITTTMVILVFGMPLASLFRYPEYMILKKFSFLNFIENIENILTIALVFDSLVVAVLSAHLVRDVANSFVRNEKFLKWWDPIYLLIMTFISVVVFNNNYPNIMILYKYEYILLLGLSILVLGIILIKKKKL